MKHLPAHSRLSGFTLVEMAVVVLLMGLMLTMGLRMLVATQNNAAFSDTRAKQDRIKLALINFLRTNGRLPCPDRALPPTGVEPATCLINNGRGVLPWRVLGLAVNDVQDGWANFFTYRVANASPVGNSNWSIKTGATAFTLNELSTAPTAMLRLRQRNDAGVFGADLTPGPVVILLSHGKNGLGARTLRGTALLPLPPTGTDERTNATANTTTFVTRTPTDVTTATGGSFDDVLASMTARDLLQPLLDDKTLKAGNATYYRDQALAQIALLSCTPPAVAPSLTSIAPSVGNGTLTYTCPASAAYSCQTGTAINVGTATGKQLYQLSVFDGAAQDVTYSQLLAAFPAISNRCP